MLALAAIALLPRFLLGFLIVEFAWPVPAKSRVLQLSLAGPLGFGISSLLSFLWIWIGLALRFYVIAETAAILLAFAFWVWSRRSSLAPIWRSLRASSPPHRWGWWACLGAAALVLSIQFWTIALANPHGSWDAWVHWNVVSRFVYRGGEHWQGTFQRVRGEADYPLMLAMTNATTWQLLQRETTRGPMVLSYICTMSLVGLLFGLVKEFRGVPQACLASMVLVTQPLLVQNGIAQYADIPAACFFLASAGMTLLYLRSQRRSLVLLAGLAAGLAAWTKNEGLVFVATSLVAWVYISWRERNLAIRDFVGGAAFPLVTVVLFKLFLAPSGTLSSDPAETMATLTSPARYLTVVGQVAQAFWTEASGLAILALILVAYALLMGRTKSQVAGLQYLALWSVGQAAADFLVYAAKPYAYGAAAMIPTSIGRLFMQILPLILAVIFLWIKSPDEINSADVAGPHLTSPQPS